MKKISYESCFLCLSLFILITVYLPIDELIKEYVYDTGGSSFTNYFAMLSLFVFIVGLRREIQTRNIIITTYWAILMVIVLNFTFAPYPNAKWLINQLGFILYSFFIATIYPIIKSNDDKRIISYIQTMNMVNILILAGSTLYLLINYNFLFQRALSRGDYNIFIAQLLEFKWSKQSIGSFAVLIFAIWITLDKKKYLKSVLLILSLSLLIGVRSFWLAATLTSVVIYKFKKGTIFITLPLIFFSFIFIILEIKENWLAYDIRSMGFLNLSEIIKTKPFGVGLGGYHVYTEKFQHFLLSTIPSNLIHYSIVPNCPESDIIAVFASLGLPLGAGFYFIHFWIFLNLWNYYDKLGGTDKFFAFLFISLMFQGIGQDNMFTLSHWITFGFALGVVEKNRLSKKETTKIDIIADGQINLHIV